MKIFFLTFIFCLQLISNTNGYPFRIIDNALFLSELTFPIALKEIQNLVVYLHDPNCLPCRLFKKEFHQAAVMAQKTNSDLYFLSFGFIDVSLEPQVHKDLGIAHFPSVVFFRNGEYQFDYNGPLKSEPLLKWVLSGFDVPFKEIENLEPFNLYGSHDIALIFNLEVDAEVLPLVLKATRKYRDYMEIFYTDNKEFMMSYRVANHNALLKSRYSLSQEVFSGKARFENLEQAIELLLGSLPIFLDNHFATAIESKPSVYYCYFMKDGENDYEQRKMFLSVYNQLKLNQVKFCRADITSPLGASLAAMVGIKESEVPTVGILDTRGSLTKKYKFSDELSTKNMLKFYENATLFKKNRFYLSEGISDNQNEESPQKGKDGVIVVTRNNFQKIVLQSKKPILVLFCTPLEINCRGFENTFRSLVYQLRNNDDITIGRMDTSKNDLNTEVEKYPLLVWYSKEYEEGNMYTGNDNIIYIKRWLRGFSIEFDD